MITDLIIGSVESNVSVLAPNGSPSALSLTVNDDTKITLNWTIGSTNHDGHRIYISTDGVNFIEKGTVTGSSATYQATGLTAGTKYYFYVKAYKDALESTASNTESATTFEDLDLWLSAAENVTQAGGKVSQISSKTSYDTWSGVTFIDSVGGNNLTLTSSPASDRAHSKIVPPAIGTGRSLYLHTVDYCVSAGTMAHPKSVSVWFFHDGTNDINQRVFQFGSNKYSLTYTSGAALIAYYNENVVMNIAYGTSIAYNKWHHVVLTYRDDGKVYSFLDGAAVTSSSQTLNTAANYCLVGCSVGGTQPWQGMIDDLRFWSTPLTDEQVTALYTNSSPPAADLAHYTFDDAPDGTASLALVQATEDNKPIIETIGGKSALTFDGSNDSISVSGEVQPSKQGYIALSFKTGSTAFATKGEQTLLTISDTAGASYYMRIAISNTGQLFIEHKNGGSLYKFSAKDLLTVSTIYTLIIDSNESSLSLKINGLYQTKIVASAADDGKWISYITGRDNITLGCLKINAESQYFEGSIFELMISNKYQSSMIFTNDIDTHMAANSGAAVIFPVFNNPTSYLTTPTYDASGAVVHPDVLDFGVAWNGYRYWMVMTPYTDSSVLVEYPSILASNDGTVWEVPPGLTNPIIPITIGKFPDPSLEFDGTTLYCYYIDGNTNKMYVTKSTDGINWSAGEELTGIGGLSPSIIKNGSIWHMWTESGGEGSGTEAIRYSVGTDYKTFGIQSFITIIGYDSLPWHLDVVWNPIDSNYWMFVAGNTFDLRLLVGSDETHFTAYDSRPLIRQRGRGWDGIRIYRTSLVIRADGSVTIWYSANGYVEDDWFVGRIDTTVAEIKTALSIS